MEVVSLLFVTVLIFGLKIDFFSINYFFRCLIFLVCESRLGFLLFILYIRIENEVVKKDNISTILNFLLFFNIEIFVVFLLVLWLNNFMFNDEEYNWVFKNRDVNFWIFFISINFVFDDINSWN